jgi:PAS domain S-box-containing protein
VLETILDDPGYRVVRAGSADQALLALVVEEFALLILDIRMPGMTGFELAQTIKARKKTAQVPIIFLTAYYNEDQHVLEGYDTGAVDYLHKPVNAPILRSKVAVFAELYRQQRAVVTANRALLAEVTERRAIETKLRELTETLDRRVIERTEALQENERFLQRITEVTPGLIRVLDLATESCVFVSRAAESLIGYCAEEVRAMGSGVLRTLTHPDDLPRVAEHIGHVRALRDGEIAVFEHRVRAKSGAYVWLESRDAVFSRDASGAPRQIIGAAFDVTARKALRGGDPEERSALPHARRRDAALRLDVRREGSVRVPEPRVVRVHRPLAERRRRAGRARLLPPEDLPHVRQQWKAALAAGGSRRYDVEARIRRRDGAYRWFPREGIADRGRGRRDRPLGRDVFRHPRPAARAGRAEPGQPPQGRVPRDARARAAEPPGSGAQRRAPAQGEGPADPRDAVGARRHRPPDAAHEPAARRPDGREPHQPGPDHAQARAPGARTGGAGRRRDQPPR